MPDEQKKTEEEQKHYEVIEPVNHDNLDYHPGQKVKLTERQAIALKDLGKIKESSGQRESTVPPSPGDNAAAIPTSINTLLASTRLERESQLNQLFADQGWKPIEAIAKEHSITKPSGGWDKAIPLILDKEFPPAPLPPIPPV